MMYKLSWHFYAVLLIVMSIAFTVGVYFVKTEEYAYEMADLQAMRAAFESAKMIWYNKLPEETVEYWYDADNYTLVPITEAIPAPCGEGTRRFGGALRDFKSQAQMNFTNYNESEDYKGKIPHVVVNEEAGELMISVDWNEAG